MKAILRIYYVLFSSVLVGWLSAGCSHSTNDVSPQNTCRIQQYVSTSKTLGFTQTDQINYEYDQQENLTKTVTTLDKHATDGSNILQTGTTTVVYTYDAGGYLTKMESQQKATNVFGGKTTNEQSSVISLYTYTSGRLTTINTRRIGAYGVNTTTNELYEYDGSGDLTKKTAQSTYDYDPAIAKEIPLSPTGALLIWTYQQNKLVDYVEKSGTSENRPITIQNGLVTAFTSNNYKTIWEYDSQQRQAKIADYHGDTLTRSTSQTWSDAKPATASLPTFKRFPVTVPAPEFGQTGVLSTSSYTYWNSISKKMETFSEQKSSSQTNAQGYVTNVTTTIKHPNTAGQDDTTTETYTYSGCQ